MKTLLEEIGGGWDVIGVQLETIPRSPLARKLIWTLAAGSNQNKFLEKIIKVTCEGFITFNFAAWPPPEDQCMFTKATVEDLPIDDAAEALKDAPGFDLTWLGKFGPFQRITFYGHFISTVICRNIVVDKLTEIPKP